MDEERIRKLEERMETLQASHHDLLDVVHDLVQNCVTDETKRCLNQATVEFLTEFSAGNIRETYGTATINEAIKSRR